MSQLVYRNVFFIACLLTLLVSPSSVWAQKDDYNKARAFLDVKDYEKAAVLYKDLYRQYPDDKDIYSDYLSLLMVTKDYKHAEELALAAVKRQARNPLALAELGNIYKATGKQKKAEEQYEAALQLISDDDNQVQQLANAFSNADNDAYAIKVYEKAISITQSPFLYSAPLARLYSKTGQTEKAIITTITGNQGMPQMRGEETVEATLLEIIGKDPGKARQAQKALIKLVNTTPDNFYYTNLLIWIFTTQGNWDQALVQVQALERRSNDKGRLLMELAQDALQKEQYTVAGAALNTVIGLGKTNVRYQQARASLLQLQMQEIERNPAFRKEDVVALQQSYASFFAEFPEAMGQPALHDYARLEAQYAGDVPHAIELLKKSIESQGGNKFFTGESKLQLGDYYIIEGKVWEAALVYSQVDKAFREDALGEEARFRNARLSYYRGDFEMAQGQLSVLKASTSELIANDALFLSVLITENIPPDSNLVPLRRFAYADLLLFQNKDTAASVLLDSLATAFPAHPLNDDILMLRSRIAVKHKEYQQAIGLLKQIIERYGKDVLADDALFRIADIEYRYLKAGAEAKKYYEQLIIDYPGSTYVQQAREQLKAMNVPD